MIPFSSKDFVGWQRLVAAEVNPILQGYPLVKWDFEPDGVNEGYIFFDTLVGAPKWFEGSTYFTFASLDSVFDGATFDLTDNTLNGTKAEFNAACSDGNFLFVGDVTTAWTQIATSTPTGVGVVTFSSIPATYSDLLLVIEGLSHNNGASSNWRFAFSVDGTNWSGNHTFASSVAADTMYGGFFIPGYLKNAGMIYGDASPLTADNTLATLSSDAAAWRGASGIEAVRLELSAGNFDAGTVTLFGR